MDLIYDETSSYMRTSGSWLNKAEQKYAELYNVKHARIFPSGMNAIYNSIKTVVYGDNGTFLYSNQLYCDTIGKIIPRLESEFGNIKFLQFKINDNNDLQDKLKEHDDILGIFVESASNPNALMIEWSMVKDYVLIVDNTWLSPVIFNPFEVGANIVVESASKYLSNGQCIAGIACTNNELYDYNMLDIIKTTGLHVSPLHCKLVYQGMENLPNIMGIISDKIPNILNFLVKNADEVIYPTLEKHSTYDIYSKYIKSNYLHFEYFPGVILFGLYCSYLPKKHWKTILEQLITESDINYLTSFGKSIDLIDRWPKRHSNKIWIRLSVGYNNNSNIIPKLKILINKIKNY